MNPTKGRIVEVHTEGSNRIGVVEFDGKRRAIYLNLVPDAQVGDDVLFHAGFATERVQQNEASPAQRLSTGEPEKSKPDLDICRASRLLSELDPQQLRKLIPLAQNELYAAGDLIFQVGDRSRALHLIASGDVALEEVSGDKVINVQTLHAGDAMGWSALTPGARTHFQARALSRVCTVAFSGDQLHAACERDPAIGYALMKRLMELVTERLDVLRIRLAEDIQRPRSPMNEAPARAAETFANESNFGASCRESASGRSFTAAPSVATSAAGYSIHRTASSSKRKAAIPGSAAFCRF